MDPNKTLREIRELDRKALRLERADKSLPPEDADRLMELVRALDEWLTKGGFLPTDWRKGRS
jgi:hypothetical protein